MPDRIVSLPSGPFGATVDVPGDKSLGHRALILAGMAAGTSRVAGLSDAADIRSTISVLGDLGVALADGSVTSPGIASWQRPRRALDCGNSGTTMRLMAGAIAGSRIDATLVGDRSLMSRPMLRLVAPLEAMGAEVSVASDGTAPLTVRSRPLHGATVALPIASAQVRTSVSLAALSASSPTVVSSPPGFRDHTERWLTTLGLAERVDEATLRVLPGTVPPLDLDLPGDPSSAAYLWAAAAVRPGSTITTRNVSLNPGRLGFLEILREMGAAISVAVTGDILGDPRGDVTVTAAPLRGVVIGGAAVAAAIDELPLVAVVAAAAEGPTTVADAAELRVKESDRLAGSVALARLAGGAARPTGDGFVVGVGDRDERDRLDASGDHRIAMAGAVAAVARHSPVTISGFEAAAVSWPGFGDALEALWS